RSPAELFSQGLERTLSNWATHAGTGLTWFLAAVGLIQGILQVVDGFRQERTDWNAVLNGSLTALGGLATILGVALAIPGLELAGAVLGTMAVLLAVVQSLDTSAPAQQLLLQILQRFAEEPVRITNRHGEQVPVRGFEGVPLFSYVVNQE